MTNNVLSVDRISFMLSLADVARVDATLVAGKTYYRFATDDSLEDGELAGSGETFNGFAAELLNAFSAGVEVSGDITPLKFTLFVNNRIVQPAVLNHHTLLHFTEILASRHSEFDFAVNLVHSRG